MPYEMNLSPLIYRFKPVWWVCFMQQNQCPRLLSPALYLRQNHQIWLVKYNQTVRTILCYKDPEFLLDLGSLLIVVVENRSYQKKSVTPPFWIVKPVILKCGPIEFRFSGKPMVSCLIFDTYQKCSLAKWQFFCIY